MEFDDPGAGTISTQSPRIEVVAERRRRILNVLSLTVVPVLGAVSLGTCGAAMQPTTSGAETLLLLASAVSAVLAVGTVVARERAWRMLYGMLSAGPQGLYVQTNKGPIEVPREQIESGIAGPNSVSYKLRGERTITAWVPDGSLPDAMLRVVGVDPERHRAAVRLRSGLRRGLTWWLFMPALMTALGVLGYNAGDALGDHGAAGTLGGLALAALATYVLHARWVQTRATVGTDGLSLEGGVRGRFVPFDAVEHVEVRDTTLVLYLRGRRTVKVDGSESPAEFTALLKRLHDARAARDRAANAPAPTVLLERGGRTLAEWRRAMQGLLEHRQGYRDVSLSLADVRRLLRDTSAALEHRVAAALALVARGEPDDRAAVQSAAAAVASTQVRVALESIAAEQPDEGAIELALREDAAKRVERA